MFAARRSTEASQFRLATPFRLPAILLLIALVGTLGLGAWTITHEPPPKPRPAPVIKNGHVVKPRTDADLYKSIVANVHAGQDYYHAAIDEQRRGHYPLHPFITVRSPVLAVTLGALPNEFAGRVLLAALAALTFAAWAWRLVEMGAGKVRTLAGLGLLGIGMVAAFSSAAYPFHETWTGLLIALSLAHRRPGKWALSLAIGLLAALTRELATPYLLVMAVLAWRDGYRREAAAWFAAIGVALLALWGHAMMIEPLVRPTDPHSQGWVKMGGWLFVLASTRWNSILSGSQHWVAAALLPFCLLGLAMWRNVFGERVALTVFGYLAAFLFIGRPENSYWGLLIAPLLPMGLLFAPQSLWVLGKSALAWPYGRRRQAVYS